MNDQEFLRTYAASADTAQRSQLATALGPTLAQQFGVGSPNPDTLPDVPTFPPSPNLPPSQPGLTDKTTIIDDKGTQPAQKLTPEQREALRQQQRQQQQVKGTTARLGVGSLREFGAQVRGLNDAAARIPTPGGLGGVAVALLVIVSMIVPVNAGHTRFELFWLTITGRTKLPAPVTDAGGGGEPIPPGANPPSSSSASTVQSIGQVGSLASAPTAVAPRLSSNSVKLPGML